MVGNYTPTESKYGPTLPISKEIHASKYRLEGEPFEDMVNRLSSTLSDNDEHRRKLTDILLNMRFLPAGRVQTSIGAPKRTTPFNCFVSGTINDDFMDIMKKAEEAGQTMRLGGGIGYDFSTLRPRGSRIKSLNSQASGPVSFMDIYDAVCKTIASSGHRRGAQMGVLRIDHPDIEEFIFAKRNTHKLTGFNISVAITDQFMKAVKEGTDFNLKWRGKVYKTVEARALWNSIMRSTWDWAEPGVLFIDRINEENNLHYCEKITSTNPCLAKGTPVQTPDGFKTVESLKVGDLITTVSGDHPITTCIEIPDQLVYRVEFQNGVILRATAGHIFHTITDNRFIWDTNTRLDQLEVGHIVRVYDTETPDKLRSTRIKSIVEDGRDTVYDLFEEITDTWITEGIVNRGCAEQPLPPYGACLLGSFNLVKYVDLKNSNINYGLFVADIAEVVRAMDNINDVAIFPLAQQEAEAKSKRRMGLGITGLANALEALGFEYGSADFIRVTERILQVLRDFSYSASIELAKEKGPFPLFDADKYLAGKHIKTLPEGLRDGIKKYGIRNSHLTSIAPTGTISLTADNISSGIEPVYTYEYTRTLQTFDGPVFEQVTDYGFREWGIKGKTADQVTVEEHIAVLVACQKYIDSACSKTCNVGDDVDWERFKNVYMTAYDSGAKGCTTFRKAGKRMGIFTEAKEVEYVDDEDSVELACFIDPVTGQKECG